MVRDTGREPRIGVISYPVEADPLGGGGLGVRDLEVL